jgi:hypothetical protein
LEITNETIGTSQNIEKKIETGTVEKVEKEYLESVKDPLREKFPICLPMDSNSLSKTDSTAQEEINTLINQFSSSDIKPYQFDKWNGKQLAKEMAENTPYAEENVILME